MSDPLFVLSHIFFSWVKCIDVRMYFTRGDEPLTLSGPIGRRDAIQWKMRCRSKIIEDPPFEADTGNILDSVRKNR